MISTYSRDNSGIITYNGPQDFCSEFAFLAYYNLQKIEPVTEHITGWPHSYVRWYGHIGIAG